MAFSRMSGPVEVFVLDRRDPGSWRLMPEALDRVELFAKRFQLDTTPERLRDAVMTSFTAPDARVKLAVGVREGVIVAHLLVSLEEWCGRTYGWLVQFQTDGAIPRAPLRACLEALMRWCRSQGAVALRIQASLEDERGPARVRAFRSVWGFRSIRELMQRDLGDPEGGRG